MERSLEPDQVYCDLEHHYWNWCCRYARSLTKGDAVGAEALVAEAFEKTYYDLCHHPEMVVERPQWWLKTAVYRCFLNSKRSKLRQLTVSLDKALGNSDAITEKLSAHILQAPDEDEPEYALETQETETERRAIKKKVILATHLDARTKQFAIHHLVEGLSYDSIAHMYGITVSQVQSAVRKCVHIMAKKRPSRMAELEGGTK